MIVNHITEITIATILNRGVPNQECIALKVNEPVNLGQFGIMVGRFNQATDAVPHSGAFPYFDNLFWFGDGLTKPGDWLFVYTGSGTPRKGLAANGVSETYSLFWGKPNTLFAESLLVPILFRVDAVHVLAPPINQPQARLTSG